jgi:hypothetical protein
LTDREITNIDHLLHLAFTFSEDFPRLERHELTKLMFQFTQGIAEAANSLATHWRRRNAPF